ncbi:Bug family tripartite tricarboxylate transporter substrate binding protein [Cupriavidus gilardii]|uniref:Bug family tripartite tricarboxylate transporter substrate binding protein n=1 Tax=Cupriavidus gilardii TaxID=82541 RepID=UPI0021B43FB2|nr:tripartite tricarboxylate transporter substrate binding protein [Cupriavidus gilardii]UXC36625.1 tripartite tricarboxylate transporter substrate binding protein [Cupriavidus gilardii]
MIPSTRVSPTRGPAVRSTNAKASTRRPWTVLVLEGIAATLLAVALLTPALPRPAFAAGNGAFPTKPVTIVSTFSAGSGPDAMMRAVAEKLALQWKTPVVIENRPGGAGFIAINAARAAAPDGHTLLLHDGDALSALPHLFKSRNFRVFDAFEPVGVLYSTPFFVVVPSSSPWKNVGDLLAAAKARPGKVSYGTWGVGSTAHLQSALLANQAGVSMLHVPYKEMGQLYTGVSTGETDWALGAMASTEFVYQSGRVRYLAVTSPQRLPAMPDVPTLAESGGPANAVPSGFVALLAPKGTSAAILARINKDLLTAAASPDVQARYKTFSFEATPWSAAQMRRAIEARSATYEQVVRQNGIKLD